MRAAWLSPSASADPPRDYGLLLPPAEDYYAPLAGAFYPLTLEDNWEEYGDLTPKESAAIYEKAYQTFLGGLNPFYPHKILNADWPNLICYFPLYGWDYRFSRDIGPNARVYNSPGVSISTTGIGDANGSTFFDGTNGRADLSVSAFLATLPTAELTVACWFKIADAAYWTDGISRSIFYYSVAGNDRVHLAKGAVAGRLTIGYVAGGVVKSAVLDGITNLNHIFVAATVSKSNDRVRLYIDASQAGADLTGLGTWSGTVSNAFIGQPNTSGSNRLAGWLSHLALWGTEFSAAQIADLYSLLRQP